MVRDAFISQILQCLIVSVQSVIGVLLKVSIPLPDGFNIRHDGDICTRCVHVCGVGVVGSFRTSHALLSGVVKEILALILIAHKTLFSIRIWSFNGADIGLVVSRELFVNECNFALDVFREVDDVGGCEVGEDFGLEHASLGVRVVLSFAGVAFKGFHVEELFFLAFEAVGEIGVLLRVIAVNHDCFRVFFEFLGDVIMVVINTHIVSPH